MWWVWPLACIPPSSLLWEEPPICQSARLVTASLEGHHPSLTSGPPGQSGAGVLSTQAPHLGPSSLHCSPSQSRNVGLRHTSSRKGLGPSPGHTPAAASQMPRTRAALSPCSGQTAPRWLPEPGSVPLPHRLKSTAAPAPLPGVPPCSGHPPVPTPLGPPPLPTCPIQATSPGPGESGCLGTHGQGPR